MKQFKDLQSGDIIYYYDHCTMKPRTVERTEWDIIEKTEKYRWGDEKFVYKYLLIYCINGKEPVKIYCTWHEGESSHEGNYFSCKEAAEQWLNGLKYYRECRINCAKALIEKETNILNKYKFNDLK